MSLWQNFCQKRSPSVTKQLNNSGVIRAIFHKCSYIRACPHKYGRLSHTAVHNCVGQLKLFLGRQGRLDLDRQGYEIFVLMVGDTCVSATILHRFQWWNIYWPDKRVDKYGLWAVHCLGSQLVFLSIASAQDTVALPCGTVFGTTSEPVYHHYIPLYWKEL